MYLLLDIFVAIVMCAVLMFIACPFILWVIPNEAGIGVCLIMFCGCVVFSVTGAQQQRRTDARVAREEQVAAEQAARIAVENREAPKRYEVNKAHAPVEVNKAHPPIEVPATPHSRQLDSAPLDDDAISEKYQSPFAFKGQHYALTGRTATEGGRNYLEATRISDGKVFKFRPEDVPAKSHR